jgi:hypothetical protein
VGLNAGKLKTGLWRLVARAEPATPGERFIAARGSLATSITVGDEFEYSDEEIDEILDAPA